MPNVNDAFPGKYLKAADLGEKQPVVTISHVDWEDVGQGAEKARKPVAYFTGTTKGVVLNKTNAMMIADIAGDPDTDNWAGTRVKLVAVEVELQGKVVMGIRVRKPSPNGNAKPKPAPEPVEAPDSDDIPF